jgi:urease accessory protein
MLDWVSEGRRALGESWTLWSWKGRNEVREYDEQGSGRLLLRDAVMLHEDDLGSTSLIDKSNNMGVFGTLIVYGPLLRDLAEFLINEFTSQPRIGAKNWTNDAATQVEQGKQAEGLLWTAAKVRGFVLVKFGAEDLDRARHWLGGLLKQEGTVEKLFGHQALMCLR